MAPLPSSKAFWFFPYYIKARAWNAWLSVQWVLTHYLTENSPLDHTWQAVFTLFVPNITPTWWKKIWADQGFDAAEGWACVFLHMGSLLNACFWTFTAYLLITTFFDWFKMVFSDIVAFGTYIPEAFLSIFGSRVAKEVEMIASATRREAARREAVSVIIGDDISVENDIQKKDK